MAKEYVFKSEVRHDKTIFPKGAKCPPELVESMSKIGVIGSAPSADIEYPKPVELKPRVDHEAQLHGKPAEAQEHRKQASSK